MFLQILTTSKKYKGKKLKEWHDLSPSWQNQQNLCAPSEDSDQRGYPPSMIRVFAVRTKKAMVLSYPLSAQWRLWSDRADAQVNLSLRWAHSHFVVFAVRRLILPYCWWRREVLFIIALKVVSRAIWELFMIIILLWNDIFMFLAYSVSIWNHTGIFFNEYLHLPLTSLR